MRARTNLATKEKRRFTISDFRGADFSSSPLRVQSNRAIDMTNWICENGTNQKRHGWAQVVGALDARINGIFPYQDADGKTELLVHAGTKLYRVYKTNGTYQKAVVALPDGVEITDERSQAFYQGKYLYLTCGSCCYLRFETKQEVQQGVAKQAVEVEPYIPTTTINIDPVGVEDTVRVSLDPVNLLTARRKNTLVGVYKVTEGTGEGTEILWQLDGLIDYYDLVSVQIATLKNGEIEILTLTNEHMESPGKMSLYENSPNLNLYKYNTSEPSGYLLYKDGKTQLFLMNDIDTSPPIAGEANITVEFTHSKNYGTTAIDHSSRIKNCRFGTLFGIGGNEDRLFLSGNPDYPNVVFFSESNDFTYFPDTFTATMGTDQSAITGFLRLSDNTLATFKEPSVSEPSVYYQTGEYRSFYDDAGNLKKITPVFSITAGATGESAINPYTSANLAGDNMILSQNGVFAIEPTSNILTVRTARERSYAVRERLIRQEGIKDAVGVAYKGRYYLSMDDVCYVADSRYKYQPEGSLSYNYEWWYWDNIPARVWAIVDGELWFGTADGRICLFDDQYTDRMFEVTQKGDLGIDTIFDKVGLTYNAKAWLPQENDLFVIRTPGAYARYANAHEKDSVFSTNALQIMEMADGDVVYVLKNDGSVGETPYTVTDVDRYACTFSLMNGEEKVTGVGVWGAVLVLPLSDRTLRVTEVDEENATFMLKRTIEGRPLDIECVATDSIAEFLYKKNVAARWCTPYFDLGTNESAKTLLKLTVSQLPGQGGKMKFGYETDKSLRELDAKGTGIFSFEDLDFDDFSFGTGFQNSHSVKVKENNFNYIVFRFLSDSDKNCSINDLTAIYKINKRNLGVV